MVVWWRLMRFERGLHRTVNPHNQMESATALQFTAIAMSHSSFQLDRSTQTTSCVSDILFSDIIIVIEIKKINNKSSQEKKLSIFSIAFAWYLDLCIKYKAIFGTCK